MTAIKDFIEWLGVNPLRLVAILVLAWAMYVWARSGSQGAARCWPIGDVIACVVGAFCLGGLVVAVIAAYSGPRRPVL